MKKYLRSSSALLVLLVVSYADAFAIGNVYFVRPYRGAEYGAGDGRSYANAWNGMAVLHAKWGNPVGPGDKVYICGTHLEGRPASIEGWLRPTVSGTKNARIAISGACPNDTGRKDKGALYAVHLQLNSSAWTDPDADGVYSQPYGGCTSPFLLEDGTRRLKWIPADGNNVPAIPYKQWPAGSFTQLGCGGMLYYKPSSGVPSNHTTHTAHNQLVTLIDKQYITIQDLRLFAGTSTPVLLGNADFIRIENNEIRWGGISVTSDSDDGEILGNNIHDMLGTGVYLITGGANVNAQSNDRWRIAYNEIHNISPGNIAPGCEGCAPDAYTGDRHGIGVQGGTNGAVVEYNHLHHIGGEGIVFYNWSNYKENGVRIGNNQRDNTIRYNYIHDIKDLSPGCLSGQSGCSNQRGIELGSDSQPALPETITGNVVHHNVLVRVNKIAFRFKSTKSEAGYGWGIYNNVVYNSGVGAVMIDSDPMSPLPHSGAAYRNNLFLAPTEVHMLAGNPSIPRRRGTSFVDNNLYYPDGPLFRAGGYTYNFAAWKTLFGFDANSLAADPLLTNPATGDLHWAGTPAVIAGGGDFRPIVGSPAIDHGVAVGLTSDIASNPIGANPDIGAYEHEGAGLVAHWQLDDGEGSTVATDASGGNHDGTLLGGPAWTGGRFGRALAFDGADDGVQAGTSGDFNLTTALTITAWIRTVNGSFLVGNSEGAVIAGKNNAYNLSIRETEGNPRLIVVGNNGTPVACGHYSGIATDTAWHHVAGTYDGAAGIMRLYIDGVLKQECNTGVPSSLLTSADAFTLGTPLGPNPGGPNLQYFADQMDDVRVYGRALGAAEIAQPIM